VSKCIEVELTTTPQEGDEVEDLEDLKRQACKILGREYSPKTKKSQDTLPTQIQPEPALEPALELNASRSNEERIMLAIEELARNSRKTRQLLKSLTSMARNGLEDGLESMGGQIPPQAQKMIQGMLGTLYQLEKSLE